MRRWIVLLVIVLLVLPILGSASSSLRTAICKSNPSSRFCRQNFVLSCNSNSDCPNRGQMFCENPGGLPSRYDCLLNSGRLQCIKSTIHSMCGLWMPWYDRFVFSCNAANQLTWTVEYNFCQRGQFCSIKHSNNFQEAFCFNFGGS